LTTNIALVTAIFFFSSAQTPQTLVLISLQHFILMDIVLTHFRDARTWPRMSLRTTAGDGIGSNPPLIGPADGFQSFSNPVAGGQGGGIPHPDAFRE